MLSRSFGLIAACALQAVSATAAAPSAPSSNRVQQEIVASLRSIDARIQQANRPQAAELPCDPSAPDRSRDLCAQWKSADQAERSADWAVRTFWLGVVGAIIGALTVAAAAAAAVYAKQAAKETKAGADSARQSLEHTRATSALQIRPWIMYHGFTVNQFNNASIETENGMETHSGYVISLNLMNAGVLPAAGARVAVKGVFVEEGGPLPFFDREVDYARSNVMGMNMPFAVEGLAIYGDALARLSERRGVFWMHCRVVYGLPGDENAPFETEITLRAWLDGFQVANGGVREPRWRVAAAGPQQTFI